MKKYPSLAKFRHFWTLLDTRLVLIALILLLFAITMLAGNLPPASIIAQAATTTPTPAEATAEPGGPQPTPIPVEYLSNNIQTNGIVFGSVVLVLIVVGVTLTVMLRGNEKTRK